MGMVNVCVSQEDISPVVNAWDYKVVGCVVDRVKSSLVRIWRTLNKKWNVQEDL